MLELCCGYEPKTFQNGGLVWIVCNDCRNFVGGLYDNADDVYCIIQRWNVGQKYVMKNPKPPSCFEIWAKW